MGTKSGIMCYVIFCWLIATLSLSCFSEEEHYSISVIVYGADVYGLDAEIPIYLDGVLQRVLNPDISYCVIRGISEGMHRLEARIGDTVITSGSVNVDKHLEWSITCSRGQESDIVCTDQFNW